MSAMIPSGIQEVSRDQHTRGDVRGLVRRLAEGTQLLWVLVPLCAGLSLLSPYFLTLGNLRNVALQSAVNIVVACAMTIIIISSGIDLSVGSVLALATCIAAKVSNTSGPLSVLMPLVVGVGFGFLNGLIISRVRIPPFICTLGIMGIARGFALIVTRGSAIMTGDPLILEFGAGYLGPVPISIVMTVVVVVVFNYLLSRTTFGRYTYAIGGNEEAARLSGVDIERQKMLLYVLGGLAVGIASLIEIGRLGAGSPIAGNGYELDAIAASVIGGTSFAGGEGRIAGTVVGAVIMGIIRNGLSLLNVSSFWVTVCIGTLIVLVVSLDKLRRR